MLDNELEILLSLKRIEAILKAAYANELQNLKNAVPPSGLKKKIYDSCSNPITASEIRKRLGTTSGHIQDYLSELCANGVLTEIVVEGQTKYVKIF